MDIEGKARWIAREGHQKIYSLHCGNQRSARDEVVNMSNTLPILFKKRKERKRENYAGS